MGPTSLFIPYIDNKSNLKITEDMIINTFYKLNIAIVISVDIIKRVNKYGFKTRSAFVHIKKWFDNEATFNLIEKINCSNKTAKLVYSDTYFWILKLNNKVCLNDNKEPISKFSKSFSKKKINNNIVKTNDIIECDLKNVFCKSTYEELLLYVKRNLKNINHIKFG